MNFRNVFGFGWPVAFLLSVVLVAASPAGAVGVGSVLRGDAIKWSGTVIDLEPLKPFYRGNFLRGIWTGNKGLSKRGVALVRLLQEAGSDGLDPSDYLSGLTSDVQSMKGKDLAAAELFLSQAFWRFIRDISSGRTTPAVTEPDIVISRKNVDVRALLKIAGKKGPAAVIDASRPKHPQYVLLRKLLRDQPPGSDLANKIVINMERWRWLPTSLGKRHVMVNQAAFELQLRDGEKLVDRRRVVVGKPFHKTPMFSHEISYAEFNPTWTVPKSIAGNEMLPKLKKNPDYLKRNNYLLYTSWKSDAPAMNPLSVNWDSVDGKNFPYRIVQQPGDNNALGQVKFLFPNRFHVYLHDTQAKELFSRNSRAFSHGCIRVEKPLEFADKLFGAGLSGNKINSLVSSGESRRVDLGTPVPIHLSYFTVWIDDNGKTLLFEDVYGRDSLVGNILFGRV